MIDNQRMFDQSTQTLYESKRRFPLTLSEEDEIYLLCSTMDENCTETVRPMQRTSAKKDLTAVIKLGTESILSTAESHLTSRLKHVTHRELRLSQPKANSSPQVYRVEVNNSMTFNVDYASTPKKVQPRASTPSRMPTPIQSTLTRSLKKKIPPPLLSSSMRSSSMKKRKRCPDCYCCCCNSKANARAECLHKNSERISKKPRGRMSVGSNRNQIQYLQRSKYPVWFLPNRRAQDIDRCNAIDDALTTCELKPFLKSCYAFGDYNVWVL